ncbi:MAG: DUF2235 domain-containing protein [Pseudomonadota bacterium]
MSKKIIFCADGTWNGPEEKTGVSVTDSKDSSGEVEASGITNVAKLFTNLSGSVTAETLALHNEQEKIFVGEGGNTRQIAKYVHGVGDSSNAVIKLLGGAFGMGVIGRIVRGYTFISRHYVPGDEIHIIGFSRGAYTARALAAMIAKVGLLNPQTYDPNDKSQSYRLGIAAWAKSKNVSLQGAGKLTDLATHMLNFVQSFVAKQLPDNGLIPEVPMKSVAVWDTVGSMGIPVYAGDTRFDVFRFADEKLSNKVEYGFHAMAIDEIRRDFPVTRWDDRAKIEQVWFVGAHSDVGGGYAVTESRLSDISLSWMTKKLSDIGIDFVNPLVHIPQGKAYGQAVHTPWEKFPFSSFPTTARLVNGGDVLHQTAVLRWQEDSAYRPKSMANATTQGIDGFKLDDARYL